MSFIYEALKRAEDDNQQRVTAPARSHGGGTVPRGRSRWWVWALIGVLGANALVIGGWLLVRSARAAREAIVAPQPGVAAPSVVVSAPPQAPAPQVVAPTPAPPPPVATPRVPAPAPRVAAEAAKPVPPLAPAKETRPARPATPTPLADARPARAPVVPPSLGSPALGSPADAPKIKLQVLVYSEAVAQRMVFIDGRRYAEGDAIDGETVLERINPDGILVQHRGQRFVILERTP
jgi:general secretion pathway protein B